MVSAKIGEIDQTQTERGTYNHFALGSRPFFYILFVLALGLGAGAYSLRRNGIFGCTASGYGSEGYLSYCNSLDYGDYDHGALWFGLEPAANKAVANAHVIFLGNSRTQLGFSTEATDDWFSSLSETYYLLGFTHSGNYTFEGPLLHRLHSNAKVYVINIDSFFQPLQAGPTKFVMEDESARTRFEEKRDWQRVHKAVCMSFKAACGNAGAFFRLRSTGAWRVTGGPFSSSPVSYDEIIDQANLASYVASGNKFLPSLSVDRRCTILTIVPTVNTELGSARAIAVALGLKFIAPKLPGLVTFDGSHLDQESAEHWSTVFFEEAGPVIQGCLNKDRESQVASLVESY